MSFDVRQYQSIRTALLENDVLFHIIHITNISRSILNQLDDWNEFDNPNTVSVDRISNSTRTGHRIIREIADDTTSTVTTLDKFKLLLRDQKNNYSYGYESQPLAFLRDASYHDSPMPLKLGGRLIVRKGTSILSGSLMLDNRDCRYLGLNPVDSELVSQLNDELIKKEIELFNKQLEDA